MRCALLTVRVWPALVACLLACSPTRGMTVVQDITVRFESPSDRSPLEGPSARLAAAAKALRAILGHPLSIELDPSLAPEYKDDLDGELTRVIETLAIEVDRDDHREVPIMRTALQRTGAPAPDATGAIGVSV